MIDEQINEQLGLLQEELARLKSVTDYIDNAKDISINVIDELEEIQKNYSLHLNAIFNLYSQYASDIKENTKVKIGEGVQHLINIGDRIEYSNHEIAAEIRRLLEKYKSIVEAIDNLVKSIEFCDIPTRLTYINDSIGSLNISFNKSVNSIEKNIAENKNLIIENSNDQNKEFKTLNSFITISLQNINQTIASSALKIDNNQLEIIKMFDNQNKKISTLKTILFILSGVVLIGFSAASILLFNLFLIL